MTIAESLFRFETHVCEFRLLRDDFKRLFCAVCPRCSSCPRAVPFEPAVSFSFESDGSFSLNCSCYDFVGSSIQKSL